ncbi:MAG TPA: hypothetical protein VFK73_08010 [Paludibacter sp.]|nr:hypothetical protein [Paludibacter sp.]
MKRLLAYCLVAVTLLAGVITTSVSAPENVLPKTASAACQKNLPDHKQSSFNAADVFAFVGMKNEQIRLTNSLQHGTSRIFSFTSNGHRIIYSEQIAQEQYASGYTVFLLKSAFKQLDGYYLYHLRKLLI